MDGSKADIGKDVYRTFSPAVDYSTVRLLVSFAFANRWKIKHWNISVAFTNALALEETYVQWPTNLPPDLIPGIQTGEYSRLNRNLYRSKSAPRLWYKSLVEFLKSVSLESVAGHPYLFIRLSTGAYRIIVIAVFVDDLFVCGEKDEDIEHLKKLMNEKFALTDGGNYYLGPIRSNLSIQMI